MGLIQNYEKLAKTPQRKIVLDLVEAALESIEPERVIGQKVSLSGDNLKIENTSINLQDYRRIIILGFGKGSARNIKIIENMLGAKITEGYVIDTNEEQFQKIEFAKGTHPLPSQANLDFTKKIIQKLSDLAQNDLVIVATCGGGSVMLAAPNNLTLEQMIEVNKTLLHSGANIHDMNVIRKHIDLAKGGGLAKILYPARVINLIFSDVPGNDLSVIASGPMVKDPTTQKDVAEVINKYKLEDELSHVQSNFIESPKEDKYFANVENILILSNDTALHAMQQKARKLKIETTVYSNSFQQDANEAGETLIGQTKQNSILLVGGETDVKVTGKGVGGRNQQLVLSSLAHLDENTIICSFDSDGWDNSPAAGAIADNNTAKAAGKLNLNPQTFIKNNDAFTFFDKVGDAILTGRLPTNVSDLMVVYKK